jgi:hypothetical protein
MRRLLGDSGWVVCKFRVVCAQLATLSSRTRTTRKALWVNRSVCTRFIHSPTTSFSTTISRQLSLFFSYFYPVSTRPTKAATSFLNLIKSLAAVKELAI